MWVEIIVGTNLGNIFEFQFITEEKMRECAVNLVVKWGVRHTMSNHFGVCGL